MDIADAVVAVAVDDDDDDESLRVNSSPSCCTWSHSADCLEYDRSA